MDLRWHCRYLSGHLLHILLGPSKPWVTYSSMDLRWHCRYLSGHLLHILLGPSKPWRFADDAVIAQPGQVILQYLGHGRTLQPVGKVCSNSVGSAQHFRVDLRSCSLRTPSTGACFVLVHAAPSRVTSGRDSLSTEQFIHQITRACHTQRGNSPQHRADCAKNSAS